MSGTSWRFLCAYALLVFVEVLSVALCAVAVLLFDVGGASDISDKANRLQVVSDASGTNAENKVLKLAASGTFSANTSSISLTFDSTAAFRIFRNVSNACDT